MKLGTVQFFLNIIGLVLLVLAVFSNKSLEIEITLYMGSLIIFALVLLASGLKTHIEESRNV